MALRDNSRAVPILAVLAALPFSAAQAEPAPSQPATVAPAACPRPRRPDRHLTSARPQVPLARKVFEQLTNAPRGSTTDSREAKT
jgi:hypothetical protein